MTRKRHGMYLSPSDDAALLQELERCTVRGRKSELLRNYALLGYQRALELCANASPDNQAALTQALAKLFAADGAPPDFRQAAEFVKARGLPQASGTMVRQSLAGVASQSQEPAAPAPQQLAAPVEPPDEAAPAADAAEPAAASSKTNWGNLKSLVGQSRKSEGAE